MFFSICCRSSNAARRKDTGPRATFYNVEEGDAFASGENYLEYTEVHSEP